MNSLNTKNTSLAIVLSISLSLLSIFNGCGTKQAVKQDSSQAVKADTGADRLKYEFIFTGENGIAVSNTLETGIDVIFECTPEASSVLSVPSPSRRRVAISFYDTKKKETNLIVYTPETKKTYWAKKNKNKFAVNVIWESDSILYTNFYDLKPISKNRPPYPSSPYTEYIDVALDKVLKSFKPKYGAVLEAYLLKKYLVYSDNSGFYLTDKNSGKLLKSIRDFSLVNRKDVSFSPDETNLLYTEKRLNANKEEVNELILADYDGSNDKIILSKEYDPREINWSPDGKTISCTIRSQSFPGTRHLAFFDISSKKTSFNAEESYGRVPSFADLAFSPSGAFLFTSVIKPGNTDTLRYYAVRNIASGREFRLGDSTGTMDPKFLGKFQGWVDDQTLLFLDDEFGLTVYNVIENRQNHIDLNRVLFIRRIF